MGYGKDLRSGFSLVEMIITMFIFTILALALTKS
ncbi:MAG: prepilin-type N-terminal cleavage/methylation domain-containing protein, partial [Opitutales bacterium]